MVLIYVYYFLNYNMFLKIHTKLLFHLQNLQKIRYFIEYIIILLLIYILKPLSAKSVFTIGRLLGFLTYKLATKRKQIALTNLDIAFGHAKSDEEKFRIANEAIDYFTANYNCSTVDGVRIKFSDGWGLVRSSNTQPVIVCRFEANTPERMEEIQSIVMNKLQEIGVLKFDGGH